MSKKNNFFKFDGFDFPRVDIKRSVRRRIMSINEKEVSEAKKMEELSLIADELFPQKRYQDIFENFTPKQELNFFIKFYSDYMERISKN